MFSQFRHVEFGRLTLDDLVAIAAYARMIMAEYTEHDIAVPAWFAYRHKELLRELRIRQTDALERQLAKAKATLQSLQPPDEQRRELAAEIERLEHLLSQAE